ncbi:MAG TPA: acyl-ACP desaturase [Acidimicrobiia bacterium]|nr:acyl-ACP desaturase [Acidimicrobiia bacterium]
MDATALIQELNPVVSDLVDRHMRTAKEWFPHEMVPYSRGRDFQPDEVWNPDQSPMSEAVRSALLVNLLTEDNLPYYFREVSGFDTSDAWRTWAQRWTAEEGRHSIVLRDYLTVTRAIDPVGLERARMQQVSDGVAPVTESAIDGLVYVTLQELATRIAHRNTGQLIDDPVGEAIMSRVAADENLHFLFYRDLATAALTLDPSTVVIAIEQRVCNFAMPGVGITNFATHAKRIAGAGIYDFAVHHDQILVPVVARHWGLAEIEGLSPEAEAARDRTLAYIDRIGRVAQRTRDRRQTLASA